MGIQGEPSKGQSPHQEPQLKAAELALNSHPPDPLKATPVRCWGPEDTGDQGAPDSPTSRISWHFSHWSFIRRHPVELWRISLHTVRSLFSGNTWGQVTQSNMGCSRLSEPFHTTDKPFEMILRAEQVGIWLSA